MFMPTEITRDSDTKVGMGIYHIQSMAFNGQNSQWTQWTFLVSGETTGVRLLWSITIW